MFSWSDSQVFLGPKQTIALAKITSLRDKDIPENQSKLKAKLYKKLGNALLCAVNSKPSDKGLALETSAFESLYGG